MPALRDITPPDSPSGNANDAFTEAEIQAMQRAVIKLFSLWEVSDKDAAVLLGGINPRTFARWKRGEYGKPSVDTAARMSNLLGAHKALRLIFKSPERSYGWVKRSNAAFNGQSALDVMLNGQLTDIMRIRRHLDTHRGAW